MEQLAVVGPVRSRGMFGGAGIFSGDVMFALIAYDTLYLKVDDSTIPDFEAEGSAPFTYEGKQKPIEMSYWQCPERLFEDEDDMREWAGKSLAIAECAKKPKKPRKSAKAAPRRG